MPSIVMEIKLPAHQILTALLRKELFLITLIVKALYVLHPGQVSCGVDILEKTRSLGVNIFKKMDFQVHEWAKFSTCGFPVILLPAPMVRM